LILDGNVPKNSNEFDIDKALDENLKLEIKE